jgi:hypothetical protein
VSFQGLAGRKISLPRRAALSGRHGRRRGIGGPAGADFSPASSEFKTFGAFFCNFAIRAARQPEARTGQSRAVYQIL